MNRRLIEKRPFEFSARVTLQLGRESISNSTVAISELIKNSYDADADTVSLDFHLRDFSVSTLIIEDSGNGMDQSALFSNWLKIGTDNKSLIGYSQKKNRVLTGAKGLGRLGIDRLCRKLVVYTKTKGMETALQLDVDWKKFENTSLSLSDIEHDIFEVDLPIKDKYGDFFWDKESSGTRMVLIGLKDNWDDSYLDKLENELRLLVSPFQAENEFSIKIKTNRGSQKAEKVINSEKILSAARWKVRAAVDEHGFVSAVFTNNQKQIDIKQEKVAWKEWIKGAGNSPLFGAIECEFHYISQDTKSHEIIKKVDLNSRDLKRFMDLNRGFRIYRDHFRVRPYGEPSGKGDWLDIGYRKAQNPSGLKQGNWHIGPNQILGAVLISREKNAILNDQANREGLVENEAFFQLRTFILKIIDTFEILAHKDAAGDKNTDLSEELAIILAKSKLATDEAVQNIKKIISTTNRKPKGKKKQASTKEILKKKLAEFEEAQEKQRAVELQYVSALESEKAYVEEQKNTLSNLASLGILTICFGHEIRQHSARASTDATEIIDSISDAKIGRRLINFDDCINTAQSIRKSIKYIENFSSLALKNIQPDKRTRKKINIPTVFRYVFSLMSETLDTMGVQWSLKFQDIVESDVNVNAFEIDWESIAINLVTNSLWAMEKIQRAHRIIQVEFSALEMGLLEVRFKDSGCGLEQGTEEHVFLPMQSGKRDLTGNVIGTGMGLAIIRNHVVDHMNGQITAIANCQLGGAEFIFTLPVTKK
ncbi:ATP-binding protein [Undibacterium sp. Rencai35W]|uniref:ATP-binding protein n=1 Tax=Undibacterium sp. Rencai35W TaxID=3413046 RepID=UPI003BF2C502